MTLALGTWKALHGSGEELPSCSTTAQNPAKHIKDHQSTLVSGQSQMKRSNPPRNRIQLYCSQPSQTQAESEAELSDFPPNREGNSKPLFAPICPRAAREASQPLPVSREEAPLSQRRRHPSAGLGQSNILNTVTAPARRVKVIPHILCYIPVDCEPM
jgi:hypothetical protein